MQALSQTKRGESYTIPGSGDPESQGLRDHWRPG